MASTNSNTGEAQSAFENLMSFTFFELGSNSYRVQVTEINGKPYVSLSKWFQSRKDNLWYPGKAPFFLPLDAWQGLVPQMTGITKRVNACLGLSGISHTLIIIINFLTIPHRPQFLNYLDPISNFMFS